MCNIRLSQKALKRKIHSVFSHALFENGRRRTGRSRGKAAEGKESCWDLESTGMFNSIQLYYHTKLYLLPHSICPASHTSRRYFHLCVCREPPPATMLADSSSTSETDRSLQRGTDHRLAILASTHQPGTFFHFLTQCYLYSFQTKFSDHIFQRYSDKLMLPVTSH